MERVEQSGTVNYDLIVIRLAVVVPYSSRVQQPMRAMAIMNGHQRILLPRRKVQRSIPCRREGIRL
jgi:hypothetical protein